MSETGWAGIEPKGEPVPQAGPGWPAVSMEWRFTAVSDLVTYAAPFGGPRTGSPLCDVNWGTHGCGLPRGHDKRRHPHDCGCCECEHHPYPDWPDTHVLCVAKKPWYGWHTRFYGKDLSNWERVKAKALGVLFRLQEPRRRRRAAKRLRTASRSGTWDKSR